MQLKYLLASILFISCQKEVIEPVSVTTPINKIEVITTNNGISTIISGVATKQGLDQSSHGVVYFNGTILISPAYNMSASAPIQLVKKNNVWSVQSINPTALMDNVRNVYKVSEGSYVWANASDEGINNIGTLYLSKTNTNGTTQWKELAPKKGFYHYAATGDIDGDGEAEIISYIGAECHSPRDLNVFKQDGTIISESLPDISVFEDSVGFVRRDKNPSQKLNEFTFGAMTVANVDLTTPEPELVMTSTMALMNEYYSFILLNYDKTSKKFKITKVIKPNGLLKQYNLAVADVKYGDFNNDGTSDDIVVTMGNHLSKDYSGIQVWINDGKGNLVADQDKSEIFTNEVGDPKFKKQIYFTNLEIGKYSNRDCVFLHFDRTRYGQLNDPTQLQTTDGLLELQRYFLINNGPGAFKHLTSLTIPGQIPTIVKGYFEDGVLRLIGLRDITKEQFELTDITIN